MTFTSRSAVRAKRKKDAKLAQGSRNVPVIQVNSHIGICTRCDREGWVNDEGICTSVRHTESIIGMEQRSGRCDTIADEKDRKERKRDAGRTSR